MTEFSNYIKRSRSIHAPFQDLYERTNSIQYILKDEKIDEELDEEFENIKYSFGTINLNDHIDEKEYAGPTNESNWVVKGKLIVGAYPGYVNDVENEETLTKILNCGVSIFVCLQEEYDNNISDENWKNLIGLRPYFKDVEKMIYNKEQYPKLTSCVTKVSLIHEKIKDCDIIDDTVTLSLAKKLVKAIYDGEIIYLHCWGGHGRTGVIVSIMFHLMYKLSAGKSMYLCQKLHDTRENDLEVCSPQTIKQRLQVTRIITKLLSKLQ